MKTVSIAVRKGCTINTGNGEEVRLDASVELEPESGDEWEVVAAEAAAQATSILLAEAEPVLVMLKHSQQEGDWRARLEPSEPSDAVIDGFEFDPSDPTLIYKLRALVHKMPEVDAQIFLSTVRALAQMFPAAENGEELFAVGADSPVGQ